MPKRAKNTSQGSAVTCLKFSGIFNEDVTVSSLPSQQAKEVLNQHNFGLVQAGLQWDFLTHNSQWPRLCTAM